MINNDTSLILQKMIDVNSPIIYINDYDFARIDELIREVIPGANINEWNPFTGLTNFRNKSFKKTSKISLLEFLNGLYAPDPLKPVLYYHVLKEVHKYLDDVEIQAALSIISQRKLYDRNFEHTIIIVSSVLNVPKEIEPYVSILEMPRPDEEQIFNLIDSHVQVNHYDENKVTIDVKRDLLPSLKGLNCFEIDRMLDIAMSNNGSLESKDIMMLLEQKKQMVKKSGVIEYLQPNETLESIGGLKTLKEYLRKKAKIYDNLQEAKDWGVATPKGVFLVGMPGCGKSLSAKAAAAAFKIPLLRMDMGNLMGKYVGESESNLRKAIKIAESAAPCILWIDEIEKAFSGVGGDNDVMTRMFGHFLSWMQDKDSPVYVFATANNAESLPPELKRKGRFDEIFCINLPKEDERKAIFEVYLHKLNGKKCKVAPDIDYDELVNKTKGYNGADIESVVNQAVENCYIERIEILHTEHLLDAIEITKSISDSCKTQINKMKEVFSNSKFTDAS